MRPLPQLLHNIEAAKRNHTTEINSTSIEPWMEGTPPADDNDFQERVLQNIKLHLARFRGGRPREFVRQELEPRIFTPRRIRDVHFTRENFGQFSMA